MNIDCFRLLGIVLTPIHIRRRRAVHNGPRPQLREKPACGCLVGQVDSFDPQAGISYHVAMA
jgi:hypothetical protein